MEREWLGGMCVESLISGDQVSSAALDCWNLKWLYLISMEFLVYELVA